MSAQKIISQNFGILSEYLISDIATVVEAYLKCAVPECENIVSDEQYWFCRVCYLRGLISLEHDENITTDTYHGVHTRCFLISLCWSDTHCEMRIIPHSSQTQYTNFQ